MALKFNPIIGNFDLVNNETNPGYLEFHVFTTNTGLQDGSYNHPYNSLQNAVNVAANTSAANIVIFMHDSPTENIIINNMSNGLTIQAFATTAKDNQTIKINGNVTISGSSTRVRLKDMKISYPGGTQPDLIDTSAGRNYFSNVDFGSGGGISYSGSWARWHEFVDCTINGSVSILGTPSAGSQISMWRTRGAPIFTLNSSNVTLNLIENENIGTITQTAGNLYISGGAGFVSGATITSTANTPDTLILENTSLLISGSTFAQINKTGTASYSISNVWRNDATDILTGVRTVYGATSADQKYTPNISSNWSIVPTNTKDALDSLAAKSTTITISNIIAALIYG